MNEGKATRYHRLRRRARALGVVGGSATLVAFIWSGAPVLLRDGIERVVLPWVPEGLAPAAVVAAYVIALVVLAEGLAFPLAVYRGYWLERRFGLSASGLRQWLGDHAKATSVGLVLALGAAQVAYWALREMPQWWWLVTAAVFAVLTTALASLAPVVLFPLFYRFEPLAREPLAERLLALAERAGTRVLGVYEWHLGARSRTANAALAGLGPTRRILLSDTLLAEYSDDEIEVILAHELAHHVHGDIRRGLVLDAALTTVALLAAHLVLTFAWKALGLRGVADVAGLPVLVAVAAACSLALVPWLNAISRAHERRADRFALELTKNPEAFISAMKRLGQQNLAEERPSRLTEWLFHSHPPLAERIAEARTRAVPIESR